MSKCYACGRGGYDNEQLDSLLGAYHEDSYYDDYHYEWWESQALVDHTYNIPAIGEVRLVERKVYESDYDDNRSYMIFEIEGELYKKPGTSDSYSTRWNGALRETHVATRQVTYYA